MIQKRSAAITRTPRSSSSFFPKRPEPAPGQSHSFTPLVQRKCTCSSSGESCAACSSHQDELDGIQPKLQVNEPGDAFEREADRIANQVVRMGEPGPVSPHAQSIVQRKVPSGSTGASSSDFSRFLAGQSGKGSPLPTESRDYFEPRFGADFANVRIHNDAAASQLARQIDAKAFTHGPDIYFNEGEYNPGSNDGRQLLAHELVHTIQQQGAASAIQRQEEAKGELEEFPKGPITTIPQPAKSAAKPAPKGPFHQEVFEERGGGGTTNFIETVEDAPLHRQSGMITGYVNRSEVVPASGNQKAHEIHSGKVYVIFDPVNCEIVVPYKLDFQQKQKADRDWTCNKPPASEKVTQLSKEKVDKIGDAYVKDMNAGLNDWYAVRISGCKHNCADKDIPVRVNVTRSSNDPDYIIDVVNRGGRANAGTICVRSMNEGTHTHEGGHRILGLGDEYEEGDEQVRQAVPNWAKDERVRTDYTMMGAHSTYGKFARFHDRHFRFADVFLRAVFKDADCTPELKSRRAVIPDATVGYTIGGFGSNIGGGMAVGIGGDFGYPLDQGRVFTFTAGVHNTFLIPMDDIGEHQTAFLTGLRLGFRYQHLFDSVGIGAGIHGTGGTAYRFGGESGLPPSFGGFVEVGGNLMLKIYGGGVAMGLGADFAAGHELPSEMDDQLKAGLQTEDQEALKWGRIGFGFGVLF